ncbi:ABC transporter permease, partial [Planctomycetota bacterium]
MRSAAALVLALCLLPSAWILGLALGGDSLGEVLAQDRQVTLLFRSVRISLAATLLATLWGAAVAAGLRSLKGALASVLEALSILPLLLPPIASVMGWVFFFGANGPCLRLLGWSPNLFSEGGTVLVLSMCYYPCISILLVQGLRSMDPKWAIVARMQTGRLRTLRHITWPLLAPYAATGALLVFLLSLSEYGVPCALGVNVYPVEIFTQMSAYYDMEKAAAFATPPIALAIVLLLLRHLLVSPARPTVGHRTGAVELHRRPVWALVALPVIAAAVLLPCAVLVMTLRSASAFPDAIAIASDQALSSLLVASSGTVLLLVSGAVLAGALTQVARRHLPLAEFLVTLPFVVPGAAVGLGIIALYTEGFLPEAIYKGSGAVAYALMCRLVTLPTLILAAACAAIDRRMSEAGSRGLRGRRPGPPAA